MRKDNKGITLIALVITVIILLILAAVSVTTLTGENGLINKAATAKENTESAQETEILQQAAVQAMGKSKSGDVEKQYLDAALANNSEIQGTEAAGSGVKVTFKSGRVYTVSADGEVAEKTALKVGNADISTVSDISTKYGEITSYKSKSHPNIDWQLFYADSSNYYVIASDYVPNAELPCNGNSGYTATDLVKSTSTTNQFATYCARFASSSSYNDGVLTAGTIYKNGSASTAFTATAGSQYLTTNYLKWVAANLSSTNTNICSVAYMMDTNKWSSFADGVSGAYAIGGPTIEMLSLSWNAVSGHTQMTDYTTLSSSNSNTNGYIAQSPETGSNFFGTSTNMWFIKEQTKAYGYWLASPSSGITSLVSYVYCYGYVHANYASNDSLGFRPIVCIPK